MLQRWGNMADDYVKEHGALDPGFMKALRSDIASQKFDNIMPEADASSPTGMKIAPTATTGPARADIEVEMRKRGLLK